MCYKFITGRLIDLDINELFLEKPCSDVSQILSYDPSEWLQRRPKPIVYFFRSCVIRPAERETRSGHCTGARGHTGARGSELSGLECKIYQLKLRPADAMMFFFYFGPKFGHLRML